MSTNTTTTPSRDGGYPAPIAALVPRARQLAETLGSVPSRNKLMQELKIGAPKAGALRDILTDTPPVLHLVTDSEPAATAPALDPTEPIADPAPTGITTETDEPTETATATIPPETAPLASMDGHPGTTPTPVKPHRRWPVLIVAIPAFIAVWSGWVGLGELTGFGIVHPLPGIADGFRINSAITLPVGVEVYAAYALSAWLSGQVPAPARAFAKWSAIGSLVLGMLGQVAYHLMAAAGVTHAPWPITTLVSCLPVAVLGMSAALAHLHNEP